jgi:hypothetical protein
MANPKPVRELSDGWPCSLRQALDGEEKPVLLDLNATGPGNFFGEVAELAYAMSELRKLTTVLQ